MAKILVLLNSGPEEPVKVTSALHFASVAQESGAEVRVIFFTDGVRVLAEAENNSNLREMILQLSSQGILSLACENNLKIMNAKTSYDLPVTIRPIGHDLIQAVEEGFQVITF